MCTGVEIAALVAAAATVGTTAYTVSQGSPALPEVKPPLPPPAAPPPPAALPPPPSETEAGEGIAKERRKRALRYGVEQTLLTSPLGNPTPNTTSGVSTRSLLGGG